MTNSIDAIAAQHGLAVSVALVRVHRTRRLGPADRLDADLHRDVCHAATAAGVSTGEWLWQEQAAR